MITLKVSDLREMIEELEKEEVKYVNVEYLEEQKFNGDNVPISLNFNAYSLDGGIEFGGIEHFNVC